MMPSQILDLTRSRMEQAWQTLRESDVLMRENAWRGSVNHAYYTMVYTALTLVVTWQVGASKHGGVISFFYREFIKTGIFT